MKWTVLGAERLADHASEWDQLARSAGYPIFMKSDFLLPALEHFGVGRARLVLGTSEDGLRAAGLVHETRLGRWVTFQPSQLPLGAWLMVKGLDWNQTLDSLVSALPGMALSIGVTQQDEGLTERPLPASGVDVLDYIATAWIDVRGTYDEFYSGVSKNLRQNLRKQRRRIDERQQTLTFEISNGGASFEAFFDSYCDLESAGWKAQQGTAIQADNVQGRFYREVLTRFAACGGAFTTRLMLDDKPIAADFGLMDEHSIVILKTTYDEAVEGLSPGQLLHEELLKEFFVRPGLERIEFYGKVMDWHTRWTSSTRMLYHVTCYRWPTLRALSKLRRKSGSGAQH